MKRKLISIICLVLTLFLVLPTINAAALYISPLAEYGDVSNNNILEALDARLILRASAELSQLNAPSKWKSDKVFGDVDGDGLVTAIDARIVLRRSAELDPIDGGTNTTGNESLTNESNIFISGKFYAQCSIVGKPGFDNLAVAFDGKDSYILAKTADMNVELLKKSGKYYLLNSDKKTYCQITSSLFLMLNMDPTDFNIVWPSAKSTTPDKKENVIISGIEYTCWTYKMSDGTVSKHYLVGNSLKFVEFCTAAGAVTSKINITSISADPSKILKIPDGYKSENVLTLFDSLTK